jgi:hypothetical protein
MENLHAQTVEQLTGVWRLVSSEFRTTSGDVIYPLGEDAQGQAIFTAAGYMSGQLMRQSRPEFASGSHASGTPEEMAAAFLGYTAYYGCCEIDVDAQTLTTHVEGSMYPNWVGGEQVRFYELRDEQLILKTPPIPLGDGEVTGVLIWERR